MPADRFDAWRARVETTLSSRLDAAGDGRLAASMRYAVLGGGKRLRPLLVYAAGQACGADDTSLDAPAAAVELIHAYSLVHDDLPAMDDDALRRGRPTVHIAFDEATAILAGDALQTLAFEMLADAHAPAELRIAWVTCLARASGAAGMCEGQALDMQATGHLSTPTLLHADTGALQALQSMHALKTGALIRAAVELGARSGAAAPPMLATLDAFATDLGLAFQIRDDILDVEACSNTLGKTAGKDQAQAKLTYPALLGMTASKQRLALLGDRMQATLAGFGPGADALRALAALAIERQH